MNDNRTTELLRKLLEERGVKWWETINSENCLFTWWESPTFGMVHAMDNEDGETLFMACLNNCDFTPEQAIAATLGSDRDEIYNAGFDNGVKATLQQLDGLIVSGYDLKAVCAWIDEQWKGYES